MSGQRLEAGVLRGGKQGSTRGLLGVLFDARDSVRPGEDENIGYRQRKLMHRSPNWCVSEEGHASDQLGGDGHYRSTTM